ncbi:cytochrome c1 [Parachitinimonas caeni]|uniref:Cytochrome c1 n=1 Tax=Parachitinimonas caeni TaxID=3031301 RepID=A0ABT7DT42_9NEIS|nr:cytochrome c1 [Parachitinimonas caeni]MDK2123134.1 cytochrome c1 [Parachitinimonas caeni]
MKMISKFLLALAMVPLLAVANEDVKLDPAPVNTRDLASLQSGAKLFTNYCLSCHGAQAMRYNRLMDIGISEGQIKENLMFAGDKVGETMKVAMQAKDAKVWLGAAPPDLSVIARSRGADWLYTYMRSFYRDPSRPTGWNNTVFDKVGMPHVLWNLQGDQELKVTSHPAEGGKDAHGPATHAEKSLVLIKAGELTRIKEDGKAHTVEYDAKVADLVNFLVWMGEPAQNTRETVGYWVMLYLCFLLLPMVWLVKREYWKDVH